MNQRQIPAAVRERRPFKCGNVFAKFEGGAYVVYSYGPHFPIAAVSGDEWLVNEDKYSRSTSKHQTIVRRAIDGPLINHVSTSYLKRCLTGDPHA